MSQIKQQQGTEYGIKRTNKVGAVLILIRSSAFTVRRFVGAGGYLPKTWKTRHGAKRHADRLGGSAEGYEVFEIKNGIMEY